VKGVLGMKARSLSSRAFRVPARIALPAIAIALVAGGCAATATSPFRVAGPMSETAMPTEPVAERPMPVLKVIARPADPDDIIRQAIAEHEMRQR
jgi:hypothetical protein